MKDRPKIRVGLCWHSPNSGNLGVGALTIANIAIAREAAEMAGVAVQFEILGFVDPGVPNYVVENDVSVTALNTRALLPGGAFWRSLERIDILLDIGAGDSFADIYGWKRFCFLFATKAIAIKQGVPLILAPQTIGPFTRQPQRSLAGWAMDRAYAVVARDPVSSELAQEIAPRVNLVSSVDVAFGLPFVAPVSPRSGVGINVSGLLFNGGYSGSNEFGMQIDYPKFSRQIIREFLGRGEKVHLIAHVNSDALPKDDDRLVADLLAKEFPEVIRAPDFVSPSEAKSYIARLQFLVGGRMHACIAAYSSHVPVIPVAYSRKFAGLFEGVLKYPHLLPVRGVDTEAATDFVLRCWETRSALRLEIDEGMTLIFSLLERYRQLLVEAFKTASNAEEIAQRAVSPHH